MHGPLKRFLNSSWSLLIIGLLLFVLIYLLYTASPILTKPLVPALEMPYGTAIAWLGLILFPLFTHLFLQQTRTLLSTLLKLIVGRLVRLALFLGVFWGLIGYYLSENWHYSFTPQLSHQDARAQTFWTLTAAIPILTLVALLAIAIGIAVYMVRRDKYGGRD